MAASDRLAGAVAAGSAFVAAARSPDGLWRDFQTLAGASSDWVTAYVINATSSVPELQETSTISLRALLRRQRSNGGWSYNATVPTDCDSTAWTVLACSTRVAWKPSALCRATDFLARHQHQASGGFTTYNAHDHIDRFIGAVDASVARGWLSPHPCVTAVALQGLLVQDAPAPRSVVLEAVRYLRNAREEDGAWQSYWWEGHGYTTYHALKALAMAGALDRQDWQRALACLRQPQHEDGSWDDARAGTGGVFATALHVLALLLCPDRESRKAAGSGVCWLLDRQLADGSWPVAPILRIPPPMTVAPDAASPWLADELGTGVIIGDQRRIFTTATVLWCLAIYQSIVI